MAGENLKTLVEERANSWILDYSYHCAWTEFFKTNEINLQTTRDFIQWIVTQPYSSTTERKQKVQILLFLCRLSDGCDHTTRYTLNSDLTALEEALKNINVIESLVSQSHAKTIESLRTAVKKQAVLVCCRANDFLAGQDVFNRLWATNKGEKNVVEHLEMVLASVDKDHNYIHYNTYNKFLKKAVACLTEIHNTFSTPYLLQQAEVIVKKSYVCSDFKHSSFSRRVLERYSERNRVKSLSPRGQQNLQMKLSLIQQAQNTSDRIYLSSPIKSPTIGSPTNRASTRSKIRRLDSLNNNSLQLIEEGSGSEENASTNEILQAVMRTKDKGNSQSDEGSPLADTASIMSARSRRIPWNFSETVTFFKALQRHGVGNWSKIKDEIKTFRTGVQLKDRWRVISKDKELLSKLGRELKKK